MKIFLLCICFVANLTFGQDFGPLKPGDLVIKPKARSELVPNCDCQCNIFRWTADDGTRHGNCLT